MFLRRSRRSSARVSPTPASLAGLLGGAARLVFMVKVAGMEIIGRRPVLGLDQASAYLGLAVVGQG